ncbi:uncharacterized protein EI97DRAFT_463436 [Westerdykella ornata]|uniref:F-box domain-containing protein n=1 Tax=Westerdykella ornata TaxID=318751 RepID=A0A6A6K119_WESOR|nr:uncharacterized protein EI97DRAFT_463436 [Westerdykella ornata]KAF2281039.1 hypothetical protein EI97DRAFT_463436 [Westerdykella ornata]
MPRPTATSRVLNTTELLELILHPIPPLELLTTLTRVSRKFHAVILASPSLFFRPDATIPPTKWILNPFLRNKFKLWFINYTRPEDFPSVARITADVIGHVGDAKRDIFLRPEASWRRMLVIQPPPKVLTVVQIASGWEDLYSLPSRAVVSFEEEKGECGVTMGAIYDITVSMSFFYFNVQFGLFVKSQDGEPPQMTLALYTGPRRDESSSNEVRSREDSTSIRSRAEERWDCGDRVKLEQVEERMAIPWG